MNPIDLEVDMNRIGFCCGGDDDGCCGGGCC